ncbi:hypothetical protein ASD46_15765 [Rhizobium sp. Root491]|uniref:hypothetical protein n=1 Tax=Rhizobium sp. Root491 TaxID=1736548 RepID=UPI000714B4E8|nr:hypothetical protein [Rhizobium sp. Root491]KQY41769.1 hypothetical protein ASD46_15765 [Rhizobium sp. Root491]
MIGDEILQLHAESKSRGGIIATIATSNKLNTARAAVRDIALSLEQDNPVIHAIATIQEYCWRLLETDLVRIRHEISRIRSEHLIIDPAALPDVDGVNDLARRVNEAVHRKFATLNLWLTQPKNVSPSAPLSLLFNAVLVEVKEQLPGFDPTIVFNEERALDLFGHRYHYVYDMLYILVYNAGKHGEKKGVLSFDVTVTDDGTSARISIESEMSEKATVEKVKKRIQVAMEAEIENAFKVDSFSGIRKIRALEVHLGEVSNFGVTYNGRRVRFSASLALTAI